MIRYVLKMKRIGIGNAWLDSGTFASLNDAISVKTYVVPMARDVEFGVELLLDTMTLVNEYTIEADSLPETGATTSSALALSMGLMAIGSGALLRKKVK